MVGSFSTESVKGTKILRLQYKINKNLEEKKENDNLVSYPANILVEEWMHVT